jgi:hypothetical protein
VIINVLFSEEAYKEENGTFPFTAIFDPIGIINPNKYKEINSYIWENNSHNGNFEIIIIMLDVCNKLFLLNIKLILL